ncbi:MAG: hypothetical protein AAF959_27045 [Cyanobacteria bacterium P01_D01_bin.56]
MLPTIPVSIATTGAPYELEVRLSMCQAPPPQSLQPVARWILEEGQLLGVLVASFSKH